MRTKEITRLLKLFSRSIDAPLYGADYNEIKQDLLKVLGDLEWDETVENATEPSSFTVEALLSDDNDGVRETVEAEPWLNSLGDDDLAYLCGDPGANETADGLYWWYDSPEREARPAWGVKVARRLGTYLANVNDTTGHDTVGFCVRLHERSLHKWVQENRPEAWKMYNGEDE